MKQDIFEQKPKKIQEWRGPCSLAGGFLIHLMLGCFYLWGNLSIYVTSYYRINYEPDLSIDTTAIIFPIMGVLQSSTTFVSLQIAEKLSFRLTLFLGSILIPLCIFISSYMTSFWLFTLFYGIFFGALNGILYMLPIHVGFMHYPSQRGVVIGIIVGAFGLSVLIANNIVLAIINPNQEAPVMGSDGNKYFGPEIANKVPELLRWLSLYFLFLGLTGSALIQPTRTRDILKKYGGSSVVSLYFVTGGEDEDLKQIQLQETNQESQRKVDYTMMEALKSLKLYKLLIMSMLSLSYGFAIANNYKTYGLLKIDDDVFLTQVGSFGGLANGGSRFFWGLAFEKAGFKMLYLVMIILQIIIIGSLDAISQYKSAYFIWVFLSFCIEGGHFVIVPSQCVNEFGKVSGVKVYSYIFMAYSLSNFIQFGLIKGMRQTGYSFSDIWWVFFGLSVVSLILILIFIPRNMYRKEIRRSKKTKIVDKNIEQQKSTELQLSDEIPTIPDEYDLNHQDANQSIDLDLHYE